MAWVLLLKCDPLGSTRAAEQTAASGGKWVTQAPVCAVHARRAQALRPWQMAGKTPALKPR